MKELVVVSGKGGTGKTSIAASFAMLADRPVVADCDVDAADLHLVLDPRVIERREFRAGRIASVRAGDCRGCGVCAGLCRFGAIAPAADGGDAGGGRFVVDPIACEGCGVCVRFCPAEAVDYPERSCGEWMVSDARPGPMVHARLAVAAENSGKLVSLVRREARRIAEERGCSLVITDGPPGIGCPVIASVTGASLVAVVAEPTVSGEHDAERVLALARHFQIPAAVCVNKWDLNPAKADALEAAAAAGGARWLGRIRYDRGFTEAQLRGLSVVETGAPSADDIRCVWRSVETILGAPRAAVAADAGLSPDKT